MKNPGTIKLFLFLVMGFIVFTPLGTLAHELGHYAVARLLGYEARLSFGFTHLPENLSPRDSFLVSLGGPLQTMLTGSLGLFVMLREKRTAGEKRPLTSKQWGIVFISLFWSRQLFNFAMDLAYYLRHGSFLIYNDESKLAVHLGLHPISISLGSALIALGVCSLVYFRFIPSTQRRPFIAAGMAGGLSGYLLWFYLLGPWLLP